MFEKLKSLLAGEQKKFAAAPLISLHTVGRPQWTPRNYAALAKEGFAGDAIGYRCVRMIAEAAGAVPLIIYGGEKELASHPLKDLLLRPNPAQSGRELIENILSFLLVAGNSDIEASTLDDTPRELVALRPDRVKVVAGASRHRECDAPRAARGLFRLLLRSGRGHQARVKPLLAAISSSV